MQQHSFHEDCACATCAMIRDVVAGSPLLDGISDDDRQQLFESLRRTVLPGPAQRKS
ncbi:hypothetical protein [Mycobacterium scrofulaceum]|uniref:hypothetical protein n=1 Tax=Mycobacterium scrofulaceum TaxID=1783 RepID=UPI000AECECEC|nr:hypothetical protein [Mycobacterium scrofulaceum]